MATGDERGRSLRLSPQSGRCAIAIGSGATLVWRANPTFFFTDEPDPGYIWQTFHALYNYN